MMHWQYTPYVLPLLVAAAVSGAAAVYAWRHRATTSVAPVLVLLGAAEWSFGYAMAIGTRDLAGRVFWAKVQHFGVALVPLAMLIFVLQYTGREKWLTWRNIILLAAVPSIRRFPRASWGQMCTPRFRAEWRQ